MYLPHFTITQKILKNIGIIEACKEVITNSPLIPAWEKQFKSEAELRTIHYGTHIEGNELSLEQTRMVIEGKEVLARQRDVWEVINYRKVLRFIDSLGKEKGRDFIYTSAILKKIHQLTVAMILPPEEAGHYRSKKVVVKNERTGEVVFRPVSPLEISFCLEDFFLWLNSKKGKEIHPVLRAGISHLELVRIHPFIDGNGRVARAFATLVLFMEGYDIKKLFSLEEHFDNNLESYYQALGASSLTGDLTFWLEYFTQVLAIELTKIKEKVQRLSWDKNLKDKLGRQIALSERQIKIIEYLKANQRLLMKEAKEIFPKISEDTILRDLKDLIKKGIVKKKGKTKASSYMLAN